MIDFNKQMEMVLYHLDEENVAVDAYIAEDSIWVSQKGMSEIFGVGIPAISKHLKNIFNEGELSKEVVISKMETTTPFRSPPRKDCFHHIIIEKREKGHEEK